MTEAKIEDFINKNYTQVGPSADWYNLAWRVKGNNDKAIILFKEDDMDDMGNRIYTLIDFSYVRERHKEVDLFQGTLSQVVTYLDDNKLI